MKQFTSGALIVGSLFLAWQVFKIIAILAYFMLPFIVIVGGLYYLGTMAPADTHAKAEAKIRKGLDWLDFKAPAWTWPMIGACRTGLDWLGLHVQKA